MNYLRQIIREQIEAAIALKGPGFAENLKDRISYLKEFEFIKHNNNDNKEGWEFFGNNGYAVFHVFVIHENDNWRIVLKIKDNSTDFSPEVAKHEIGPERGFDEFVNKIKNALENNLVMGSDVFKDNMDDSKEEMVEKLLQDLAAKETELGTTESPNMDKLKAILTKYKDICQRRPADKAIEVLINDFNGIDNLIYALQDAEKINFYNKLKEF